ncbi:hypothetical protein M3G43_16220 [Brevibacterium casei]|uniref:hypothetical protein n=1 Tax=Brevibacterium casei TaxID=33889 RepID=UPI00223A9F29|nr:hypothetical protein [Brevibacterium casei]MCT1448800.1 hypothetical protein [Brevibacterium casei]
MTAAVFSRASSYCAKRNWTKAALEKRGIEYIEKALEDQPEEWLEELRLQGMLSAPVVRVEYETGGSVEWCDYRHDFIEGLVSKRKQDTPGRSGEGSSSMTSAARMRC